MKCICGYESTSWGLEDEKEKEEHKTKEKFVQVHSTFLREFERRSGYHDKTECCLFACPKCNTIQLVE